MHRALRGLAVFACVGIFSAPAPVSAQTQQQQSAGLESEWEIATVLQSLSVHASRVLPMLERLDPKVWTAKGAPQAYAAQWQSGKEQAGALADGARELAKNPEVLSAELQLLFRELSLESTLGSVAEVLRKYQSPELAQEVIALAAEAGPDRDRLQRYAVNLAAEREKEYQVMDQEAQRCRAAQLAPSTAKKKK